MARPQQPQIAYKTTLEAVRQITASMQKYIPMRKTHRHAVDALEPF